MLWQTQSRESAANFKVKKVFGPMYDSLKVERDDINRHSDILHKEIENFKMKLKIERS